MRKLFYVFVFAFFTLCCSQLSACDKERKMNISIQDTMKLKITIGDKTAEAILYDNPTSRDFASLLPLTVELKDYSNIEKVFTLSKELTIEGAPDGFDPSIGDLTYYAPWGNIALFYKDFSYADGLVSLGKITSGLEHFIINGSLTVKFELEH